MKFDILHSLREHLNENYNKNTANNYYFAVKNFFSGIDFNELREIPIDEIERRMLNLKSKRDFSAAKCGLKQMKICYPELSMPSDSFFANGIKHKRNYKKRKPEPLKLDTVKRRINVIRDKKLKLAYRLMLVSGLRVSEVSALNPENIIIEGEKIKLNIINGKGGKNRNITTMEDTYLAKELPQLIESLDQGERLFYTAGHMINKAVENKFQSHDLRRAFSKTYYKEQKKTAPDIETAKENVMDAMGHSKWRTTKIYLKRKIEP